MAYNIQESDVTALNFLVRVQYLICIMLFASEHAQSGLKYNKELVHRQCFQSIMTGLSNDHIGTKMRMSLSDEHSSGNQLLLQKKKNADCPGQ